MRDIDVRLALRDELSLLHADDATTAVVEEMGIWSGSVRIDLAVINGEMTGYELKSDRDTLARLPLQAELYSMVFDKLYLVCGATHYEKASDVIPYWWGIVTAVSTKGVIKLIDTRAATQNPNRDPLRIAQLLWKDEVIGILRRRDFPRGMQNKAVKFLHQFVADMLSLQDLSVEVRETLKRRPGWLRQRLPRNLDVSIDSKANPSLQI